MCLHPEVACNWCADTQSSYNEKVIFSVKQNVSIFINLFMFRVYIRQIMELDLWFVILIMMILIIVVNVQPLTGRRCDLSLDDKNFAILEPAVCLLQLGSP